ncbi:MAG: class I SAM-dependent methyltransferase family protein [Halobacteriales archaeon]|nr:class I SAM-dependent methyltransferase family protein [Halobacteriales archaeon]
MRSLVAGDGSVLSLAVKVPRERGEEVRQRLRGLGLLRMDLKPLSEGPSLLLPVRDGARDALLGYPFTTAEFDAQEGKPASYQELAQVPDELRALLPTSFDVVGDLIVVKLEPGLLPHAAEVGRALLAAHKGARGVLLDEGVQGTYRIRALRTIAGEPRTRTEHREHGLRLDVDLAKAYFSPRLASEHARVAEQVRQGEVVLDLFAGVGPFALLIAKHGKAQRVYAVDLNADAVEAIQRNAQRNKVEERVQAVLADADEFARSVQGRCDRVIMNLPHGADQHWEQALGAGKPRAVVHYHRIIERAQVDAHVRGLVERAALAGWRVTERERRVVRDYSPAQSHYAVDFEAMRDG